MDPIYVPVVAALAGALIGSLSSIGTIYIQSKIASGRERMKQAVELAIQDHKAAVEIVQKRGGMLPPITAFLHYHEEILRAYENGSVTPEKLREIRTRNKAMMDTFVKITEEGRESS